MELSPALSVVFAARGHRSLLGLIQQGWAIGRDALDAQGLPGNAVLGLAIVLAVLFFMKQLVVLGMPINLFFESTSPARFPDHDLETLARLTREFEALGFRHALDYSVRADPPVSSSGFARLLVHPDKRGYAEINQVFPNGKPPAPMGCLVASLLDDGWQLSTTDRKPNASNYLLRRRRSLWTAHPGAAPADLWREHLTWRQQITSDLMLKPLADTSPDAYFANERRAALERQENLRRKFFLALWFEMIAFQIQPKSQWMGDYDVRFV
jgi:hypothetical protein